MLLVMGFQSDIDAILLGSIIKQITRIKERVEEKEGIPPVQQR
jgi:hypothetical protein